MLCVLFLHSCIGFQKNLGPQNIQPILNSLNTKFLHMFLVQAWQPWTKNDNPEVGLCTTLPVAVSVLPLRVTGMIAILNVLHPMFYSFQDKFSINLQNNDPGNTRLQPRPKQQILPKDMAWDVTGNFISTCDPIHRFKSQKTGFCGNGTKSQTSIFQKLAQFRPFSWSDSTSEFGY